MQITINPVDPTQPVALPAPWPALETKGFHPDLVLRAKGFALKARRDGFGEIADEFLTRFGEGFAHPFDPGRFDFDPTAPDFDQKLRFLATLETLSQEFGDRVSAYVWYALGYLGLRENPEEYASILSQKEYLERLNLPWWLADTVLHALGKVYRLKMHVDSRIYEGAGVVLDHNCDCSCYVAPATRGSGVAVFLENGRMEVATGALFSHLLSEGILIAGLKLPFEMGVSSEAAEVMSIGS